MALTRLTLLGTGNFNEKTAKLYSDFMLMTAHPASARTPTCSSATCRWATCAATTASWVWRPSD